MEEGTEWEFERREFPPPPPPSSLSRGGGDKKSLLLLLLLSIVGVPRSGREGREEKRGERKKTSFENRCHLLPLSSFSDFALGPFPSPLLSLTRLKSLPLLFRRASGVYRCLMSQKEAIL